jgi:hypothetical protein
LAQAQNHEDMCVRIDKVGAAPGVWSGILLSTQWLNATVVVSTSREYKVGDKLSFGMNVVQRDKFADAHTPRLNPKIIHAGAVLTLDTKASCRADGSTGWVATCIKKGCSTQATAGHKELITPNPPKL